MDKIKVCHVVSGLKAGGVESFIFNYCSRLDSQKYEWHLLYQHEPCVKNVDEFKKIGFKLTQISYKLKHPLKNFWETFKYLKNEKIDVVHCHMTLMNFIPLIAARLLNIKVRVCHSHNADFRNKRKIYFIIECILKKICVFNSTILLSCGNDAGKFLYGKNKFMVINNAIDLEKFAYNENKRKKIREDLLISDDDFVIGHVGRFSKQKNQIFIARIMKKIMNIDKNIKIIFIGDGEFKDDVYNELSENECLKNVIFTGIIDNVNDYYNVFDLFVLPSLWEGLPIVALEAQVSNLPCFFSKNIDKNCKINDNVKFLDITNEDTWCENIINCKKEKCKRENKVDNFNNNNLNIVKELEKIDKIYEVGS